MPHSSTTRRRTVVAWSVLLVLVATGASTAGAAWLFSRWQGSAEPEYRYAMPGVDALSFSSPQTLEVARQIEPFLTKNNDRIRARTKAYEEAVAASLETELTERGDDLLPKEGEQVVLAEADPQGSLVGTAVRGAMYAELRDVLGEDAVVLRTISGDVTSNGTVAEAGFVADEPRPAGTSRWPAVVKGDHDTDTTVEQLTYSGVVNPHLDVEEVGGLDVSPRPTTPPSRHCSGVSSSTRAV